ncbi:MAG: LOG family protein [Chlorobiaceae bacterium]|nr:LOG family protein [Chlorobiaceae bacterium]
MDLHYRVAIFGSARLQEGDADYRHVFTIAKGLAEYGFDIVTGGGPGLMQAANSGTQKAKSRSRSIGLNIKLPKEQEPNPFLDIKEEFSLFSSRLDTFMALSDAVVVAPGGIGTLLELFYAWQLVQVEHICETPIILFGEIWTSLLLWLETEVMPRQLFSKGDMHMIFHVMEPEQVVGLIKKIHDDRLQQEHACRNFSKYRIALQNEQDRKHSANSSLK